jgi:hypothetical protein
VPARGCAFLLFYFRTCFLPNVFLLLVLWGTLQRYVRVLVVGGDGLVVPSWLALCWIAEGPGFKSQRGHLFFGISPRAKISQEGFVQRLVSPPATSRYIGSVRIISEAPLVCPNGC